MRPATSTTAFPPAACRPQGRMWLSLSGAGRATSAAAPLLLALLLGSLLVVRVSTQPAAVPRCVNTVAGGAGAPAPWAMPASVITDADGMPVFAAGNSIFRVAGVGTPAFPIANYANKRGFAGDLGPASDAQLYGVSSLALMPDGAILAFDCGNSRIRRISVDGMISTFAGGDIGYGGDGGPATAARFFCVLGVFFPTPGIVSTRDGDVIVSDTGNNRLRLISGATGIVTTLAGSGSAGWSGDNGGATLAMLNQPTLLALDDSAGSSLSVVFADSRGSRIRRIDLKTRMISHVAGTGVLMSGAGDNLAANKSTVYLFGGLAVQNKTVVFGEGEKVRTITPSGLLSTFAGNGLQGATGNGGDALLAAFDFISALYFDKAGNLLVAEAQANSLRSISPGPTLPRIITLVLRASPLVDIWTELPNRPATSVSLKTPADVHVSKASGRTFFTDAENNAVFELLATGAIARIAGTGGACLRGPTTKCGDGGPALLATLNLPYYFTVIDTPSPALILSDNTNKVRRVDLQTGYISTVAGTGEFSASRLEMVSLFNGDGPALSRTFFSIAGASSTPDGSIYLCDTAWGLGYGGSSPTLVRKLVIGGDVTTVAGYHPAFLGPASLGANFFIKPTFLETRSSQLPLSVVFGNIQALSGENDGSLLMSDNVVDVILRFVPATGLISLIAGVPFDES